MERPRRKLTILWPVAICSLLAGCFEINSSADFNEKGEVVTKIELAVSAELLAIAANANAQKGGDSPVDYLDKCGQTTPSSDLPKGVKSVKSSPGQRSGMFTCTIEAVVTDPVAAIASLKEKSPSGPNLTVERISGVDGYRIAGTLIPPKDGPFSSNKPEDQFASSMAIAMFANRFISIEISGLRIENHNGEASPDQTKAVWKIPLLGIIGPGASRPFEIKADVIYAEPWYTKLKRKLFG